MLRTSASTGDSASVHGNHAALVGQIGAVLTSNLVLDDVLFAVARMIGEALDVWECDLYDYAPERNTLTAATCWVREPTPSDLAWVGTVVDLNERPGYWPVIKGRRVVEDHIDDEGLDPLDRALMEKWGERTTVSVPLVVSDSVIGCLVLIEKRTVRRFTEEEHELLAALAAPAAIAIQNAKLFQRQREQHRRLVALLDSSRALTSTVVLQDLLNLVARKTAEALGVKECGIYEYDASRDAIVSRAVWRQGEDEPLKYVGRVYPLDEWPRDRWALETGQAFVDLVSDRNIDAKMRAAMLRDGQKSALTVPFAFGDETHGLIHVVESAYERRFTDAEIELARGLGEQASIAIAHARLYQREEERRERLLGLLDACQTIASAGDLPTALAQLRHHVSALLGDETAEVEIVLSEGGGASAGADPVQETDDGLTSLVVPLLVEGKPAGYVGVRAQRAEPFPASDVELVQIIANQAGVTVENDRLYRAVEEQAITDGLTGLYNYRYFYRRLEEEAAKALRYETPLSLLMLDIDDFKRFNDRYGHPAGDQVLREVAATLKRQLRDKVDLPARYGGEEFVILLPNTPLEGAQTVGERLQREVASLGTALHLTQAPSPAVGGARGVGERIRRSIEETRFVDDGGRREARLTVSVGVACLPDHAPDGERLVGAADKALYVAKRKGKNRVEIFA